MTQTAILGDKSSGRAARGRRRRLAFGGLLLVSMALHALVLVPLTGQWGGARQKAASPPEQIQVVLLQPDSVRVEPPPAQSQPKPAADAPSAQTVPKSRAPRPAAPGAHGPSAASAKSPTAAVVNQPVLSVESPSESTNAVDAGESPGALASAASGLVSDVSPEVPAVNRAPNEPAAGAATEPPLPSLPASRSQRFRVYWGDFSQQQSVARLEYRLVNHGDRYELRTDVRAEGLISLVYSGTLSQLSRGSLGPNGLEPARYAEIRSKSSERVVDFDRKLGQLMSLDGSPPVPMPVGTQDRLSVFYQLGLMMRREPSAVAAGQVIDMPVASMRAVQRERFVVVGEEMLMAPGGPIRALHLQRPVPAGTRDPRIDLWLGYDFEMMPVRLRLEESADRVLDQVIDRAG